MKYPIILNGRVVNKFNTEQEAVEWINNHPQYSGAWYVAIDTESNADEFYAIDEVNKTVTYDSAAEIADKEAVQALSELQKTEDTKKMARMLEELYDKEINGTPLPVNTKTNKTYAQEWLEKRKAEAAKIRD